jgi:PAS domain S-box-containing protein
MAFCELLGYRPEELRNKTWQELTPADDIGWISGTLTPLLRGEQKTARFEKRGQEDTTTAMAYGLFSFPGCPL